MVAQIIDRHNLINEKSKAKGEIMSDDNQPMPQPGPVPPPPQGEQNQPMYQQTYQPPIPGGQIHSPKKEPFYKKTWFVVLLMILVPPVGILLAWIIKKPVNLIARILLTILSALIILGTFVPHGQTTTSSNSAGTNTSQTSTPSQQSPALSLETMQATYTGACDEGIAISEKTSGLTVTGTYSDGSQKKISDFKVDNPSSLVAGQTTNFTISSEGKTCTVDITCTTLTEDQFKASCQAVDYETIARDPDAWLAKNVMVTGEVIQVQESASGNTYRVSITQGSYGIWQDPVLIATDTNYKGTRILEKDIVTVYGTSAGLYTYTTVFGASQTVPSILAKYIVIG